MELAEYHAPVVGLHSRAGRGPDRVETLAAELGEVKARIEKIGEKLIDEFRNLDRILAGLKEEGMAVAVRLSAVPVQAAYNRHLDSPGRPEPKHAGGQEPETPTWLS